LANAEKRNDRGAQDDGRRVLNREEIYQKWVSKQLTMEQVLVEMQRADK
jgi:hypothetical protein